LALYQERAEEGSAKQMKMQTVAFTVRGKKYKFKEPLPLERDDDIMCKLCFRYDDLNLIVFGNSWVECGTAVQAQFVKLWEDIVLIADEKLTEEGIAYKNKLLAMVE